MINLQLWYSTSLAELSCLAQNVIEDAGTLVEDICKVKMYSLKYAGDDTQQGVLGFCDRLQNAFQRVIGGLQFDDKNAHISVAGRV